jgi:hypothetical protein
LYAYYGPGLEISYHYETLRYTSYHVDLSPSRDFIVKLTLNNTGTVNSTLSEILLNGTSWNERDDVIYENITGTTLAPGQLENGVLILSRGDAWTNGLTFEIAIKTEAGREYPKTITLP